MIISNKSGKGRNDIVFLAFLVLNLISIWRYTYTVDYRKQYVQEKSQGTGP